MSEEWQGVPISADKDLKKGETGAPNIPHSGDLGFEEPVTEFDNTTLEKAHGDGILTVPASPATMPGNMPPLETAHDDEIHPNTLPEEISEESPPFAREGYVKGLDARNSNLKKLIAFGAAAVAGVGGLLFMSQGDEKNPENPAVSATTLGNPNVKPSTETTSTPETTSATDLDRERARTELRLAEPIYAYYKELTLPTEQDVMLLFRNIMMGDLTGDLKFFRASFGDDFDPYGNDREWMVRSEQLQQLRDDYGEEVLPNIHYSTGPDDKSSNPIIRDPENDSGFYVYIKTTANSDNQYDTGNENYVIRYSKVGLKIEYSEDAGREIWTIDKLEPLNVVEDNT